MQWDLCLSIPPFHSNDTLRLSETLAFQGAFWCRTRTRVQGAVHETGTSLSSAEVSSSLSPRGERRSLVPGDRPKIQVPFMTPE